MNESFKRDFAALLKKAGDKAEMVVRKTALELQSSMIEMSPVGDPSQWKSPAPEGYTGGRFKGNWQCGVGVVNTATDAAPDKDGNASTGRTQAALGSWKVGQTIWLTNSLPYARRLEYGWSKNQAPGGFVRLTVQNYGAALAKAVASIQ